MSEPKQKPTKRAAAGEAPNHADEPRRRNRAATEAALIAAGTATFAERGYEATTTKAIAERAGCSEALIQIYFKGKEGLLNAVLYHETSALTDQAHFFERALCDSFEEEVRETFAFVVKILAKHSTKVKILMSRALVDPDFQLDASPSSVRSFLRTHLRRRFEQYVTAKRLPRDFDVARTAEMLLALVFTLGFLDGEVFRTDATERKRRAALYADVFSQGIVAASPKDKR